MKNNYKVTYTKIKFRLLGYQKINFYGNSELNNLADKLLPIYNYIEMKEIRTPFYSFLYSIVLFISFVILL